MDDRIADPWLGAVKDVPAAAALGRMLKAPVDALGRDQLARLAPMTGLTPDLRIERLYASRANRRRSARDRGESDDGGIELFPESRPARRSSSSIRSSIRRITSNTASGPCA